jgi:predicted RNA binding protein YcfA (HicA-like mRNA interferase family)
MALDYRRLRSITAREVANALLRDGFKLVRQKGSHQRYVHPDGRRVTLTFHSSGDTFEIKTLRSMIEQARWNDADLHRLGLLTEF